MYHVYVPPQYSHVDPILHMTVGGNTSKSFTAIRDFYNKHLAPKLTAASLNSALSSDRPHDNSTDDHHKASNPTASLRSKL